MAYNEKFLKQKSPTDKNIVLFSQYKTSLKSMTLSVKTSPRFDHVQFMNNNPWIPGRRDR